jgi:S1-C subfamily serine protease
VHLGVGSGLLVEAGVVLTNAHVVRGAQRLRVTFASGRSVAAEPEAVFQDLLTDLAIIRLPEPASPALAEDYRHTAVFADSDRDVERGDLVVAVGSPHGLRQSVTHGIISAKGRLLPLLDTVELLQTDAPINPGNSGGPLFDQYGRVIGINVAIASDTGGSQGIGFAIPATTARAILAKLTADGEVVRGFIGAILEELPSRDAQQLGLGDAGAVRISQVVPSFPAEKGGLRPGDVIISCNQEALPPVHAARELRQKIQDSAVGQRLALEVLRGGTRHTLSIAIGRRPAKLP